MDPRYYRPTEVVSLPGDPSKAREVLDWEAHDLLRARARDGARGPAARAARRQAVQGGLRGQRAARVAAGGPARGSVSTPRAC
ncbi:MAG TPA: hypothetical protein VFH61_08780 [Thermoleophilia bacterium]|nr:hypothetical protein [Thermoleophilia bacterium]